MHLEIVTPMTRADIGLLHDKARLFTDEPDGLLAALAWETDDGSCSLLLAWASSEASVDWTQTTMWAVLASGEMAGLQAEPPVPVHPVETFLRTSQE